MKTYVGTKMVKARPMSRAEYNEYQGWDLPADENGEDSGYLVEYLDGGLSNHPEHENYISWSPADVFEKAYGEVQDTEELDAYQVRMVVERRELFERLVKLKAFRDTPKYRSLPRQEKTALTKQAGAMQSYLEALGERLPS